MSKFKKGDMLVVLQSSDRNNVGKVGAVIDIIDGDYYTLDVMPNYAFKENCVAKAHGADLIREEDIKKAFQFPDWPAGTEIVCYCRSTDSRDTIEQIAQRGGWKIVKYVHIDELPIAKFQEPGQVMFAKREALEWKYNPTPIELSTWRDQMLGGLCPSDWDKFIVR